MNNLTKQRKQLIIEQLEKTPIVQVVCEKTNISRATYYRWQKEDLDFKRETNKAIKKGSLLVNDLAESQLISAIKDKNLTAIIFWLKNHHQDYATKVIVDGQIDHKNEILSKDQQVLIDKALGIVNNFSLINNLKKEENEK